MRWCGRPWCRRREDVAFMCRRTVGSDGLTTRRSVRGDARAAGRPIADVRLRVPGVWPTFVPLVGARYAAAAGDQTCGEGAHDCRRFTTLIEGKARARPTYRVSVGHHWSMAGPPTKLRATSQFLSVRSVTVPAVVLGAARQMARPLQKLCCARTEQRNFQNGV